MSLVIYQDEVLVKVGHLRCPTFFIITKLLEIQIRLLYSTYEECLVVFEGIIGRYLSGWRNTEDCIGCFGDFSSLDLSTHVCL